MVDKTRLVTTILPQGNNTKGLFAVLKFIDGSYFSKYYVNATFKEGNTTGLVSFYENGHSLQYTIDSEPQFEVTFDFPFYLTHYSFMNAYYIYYNTYPIEWKIYGKNNGGIEREIDHRSGYFFCGENQTHCPPTIKTFSVNKPGIYTSFTIKGIGNSDLHPYLILSSFDFFGSICAIQKSCRVNKEQSISAFILTIIATA